MTKVIKKSATIQDVARRARVSTATVSRVLSAPDSVSDEKRIAVDAAIRSTGYRVNRAARNLRTQRSQTVLALLPELGNPFFSQVLQGIESVLTPAGQSLIIAETKQIHAAGDDLIDYLEDQRADGAIVLDSVLPPSSVRALADSPEQARVVFACEWVDGSHFPSVRSANFDGAKMAVQHLFSLGHRTIAHVTGPHGNVLTHERLAGFEAGCIELGIKPALIRGEFTLESGLNAARELLQLEPRPTAVFCASDIIAFGLIATLSKHGTSVPNDISVMGFDDIELSEHYLPALTSIRQDRIGLGAQAARLLLHCLGAGPPSTQIETIGVELITRGSCQAL